MKKLAVLLLLILVSTVLTGCNDMLGQKWDGKYMCSNSDKSEHMLITIEENKDTHEYKVSMDVYKIKSFDEYYLKQGQIWIKGEKTEKLSWKEEHVAMVGTLNEKDNKIMNLKISNQQTPVCLIMKDGVLKVTDTIKEQIFERVENENKLQNELNEKGEECRKSLQEKWPDYTFVYEPISL